MLARPADAFVAGFVGRDRGYRALGFSRAGDAADPRRADRRAGRDACRRDATDRARTAGCWWSTTQARRRAGCGWPNCGARAPPVTEQTCCTAAAPSPTQGGTLRAALDACLSSPTGRGVVVDADGAAGRHGHRRRGAGPDRAPRGPASRTAGGGGAMIQYFREQSRRDPGLAGLARLAVGVAAGARADHRVAAGLAGAPLPLALPAAGQRRRPALHDPVAGAVHHAAGHPEDQDPRSRSTWWSR